MESEFNLGLLLHTLAVILVFIQNDTSSIFIDASLVFISLGLAKINKDKGRKFDYYAWLGMFILFLILFIFKAFILV